MNCIKYILLIALCGHCLIVCAQDQKDQGSDPYKLIYDLREELTQKDAFIDKLKKDLAKAEERKNEADSLLKVEMAVGKSKEIRKQLKELERANENLRDSLNECSASVAKTVSQQVQQCQEQLDSLMKQHLEDTLLISSLRRDLNQLSGFRKMWLTQLAESVNEKWLDKKYSDINVAELESALHQYEEFASADKRIEDASVKLKSLLSNCQIYEQGVNAVNSCYNANDINSIIPSVKLLRDQSLNPDNKKEVALLFLQLDDYKTTIVIFQNVIKAVEEQIAGQAGHKSAWPLVKAELERQEQQDEYITAIKKIPWLCKQYDLYYKALENNCVAQNSVRKLIMSLQP